MITLIKKADIYAPQHLGIRDILIAGEKILAVEPEIAGFDNLVGVSVIHAECRRLMPGIIDLHVHITGGGGELGYSSRVPELQLTDLIRNGITTVLGLLGTDGITRSQENLLAKCRALNEEGITAYYLCGSYQYPSVTITGSVMRDIALFDCCVGVKTAISDHRSSGMTGTELIRLASDARLGGLISGKPGLVTLHVGSGEDRLSPVFYALAHSDIPVRSFLPTHMGLSPALIKDAEEFAIMGGTADFTADYHEKDNAASQIFSLIESGADPSRFTISSDSFGSIPRFDIDGNCIGMTYTTPQYMLAELRRLVLEYNLSLDQALLFFCTNPARVLGKTGVKGVIAPGADADIVIMDENLYPDTVIARGHLFADSTGIKVRGRFE